MDAALNIPPPLENDGWEEEEEVVDNDDVRNDDDDDDDDVTSIIPPQWPEHFMLAENEKPNLENISLVNVEEEEVP